MFNLIIKPPLFPNFSLIPIFMPHFTKSLWIDLNEYFHFFEIKTIKKSPTIYIFCTKIYSVLNYLEVNIFSIWFCHLIVFLLSYVLSFITLFVFNSIIYWIPITIKSDSSACLMTCFRSTNFYGSVALTFQVIIEILKGILCFVLNSGS
jgi:hypothetical protein